MDGSSRTPQSAPLPSILVVGLGNPILGDDGVGWVIAQAVQQRLTGSSNEVEVACYSLGGLSLMEHLTGYQRAILIDAVTLGSSPVGALHQFKLDELPDQMSGRLSSSHDTTLQAALAMGRRLGAPLPEHIIVIGVETAGNYDFSEQLSPEVAAVVPKAVDLVLQLIQSLKSELPKE